MLTPSQDPENPDKMVYDYHRITENLAAAKKAKEEAAEAKGTNSIFKTLTKGLDTDVHDVVVRIERTCQTAAGELGYTHRAELTRSAVDVT